MFLIEDSTKNLKGILQMPKKKTSRKPRRKKRKVNPEKAGKISKKEMVRTRMRYPSGALKDSAPVEAIKGIGVKKANALRKRGISTVGEYKRAYKIKSSWKK